MPYDNLPIYAVLSLRTLEGETHKLIKTFDPTVSCVNHFGKKLGGEIKLETNLMLFIGLISMVFLPFHLLQVSKSMCIYCLFCNRYGEGLGQTMR